MHTPIRKAKPHLFIHNKPVEEAIPERLPQLRLTITSESLGLKKGFEEDNIKVRYDELRLNKQNHIPNQRGLFTYEIAMMFSESYMLRS